MTGIKFVVVQKKPVAKKNLKISFKKFGKNLGKVAKNFGKNIKKNVKKTGRDLVKAGKRGAKIAKNVGTVLNDVKDVVNVFKKPENKLKFSIKKFIKKAGNSIANRVIIPFHAIKRKGKKGKKANTVIVF